MMALFLPCCLHTVYITAAFASYVVWLQKRVLAWCVYGNIPYVPGVWFTVRKLVCR